jgi:hypothetical protein
MPMKKHKPEQILSLLRQIEVQMANGKSTPQACRKQRSPFRRSTAGEKSTAA